ncbi:MAG: MBL fold metallo-hydrolase [Deltaproteobacteria bacterium]|jgi:L-ascorbate metabolism protein UlaG (beta-lactamase superfamily)|nr:MBL fold metallo-hydrolase [Deltaproteobacteria bacterium]
MLAILLAFLALVLVVAAWAFFFLRTEKFGALPRGERLARIQASPNYRGGLFQNLIPTPRGLDSDPDSGFVSTMAEFFKPKERLVPSKPIPSVATDLKSLPEGSLVWFGHSAFLIKIKGRTILVDPSLSRAASPLWFVTRAFAGAAAYDPGDLPDIDYLLVSHDHWDHLDHPTMKALRERIGSVVVPLGVGAHFERWGFPAEKIFEGDWWESFTVADGLTVTLVPSRHFSGRGLTWNRSLWAGFLIEAGGRRIFYSGDGGFLPQYAEFGERLGEIDLAVMECGQYDRRWAAIHMTPEETVRAAGLMRAKAAMPVHSGKFSIANHTWDDPFVRFKNAMRETSMLAVTPIIGRVVDLNDLDAAYPEWWTIVD